MRSEVGAAELRGGVRGPLPNACRAQLAASGEEQAAVLSARVCYPTAGSREGRGPACKPPLPCTRPSALWPEKKVT